MFFLPSENARHFSAFPAARRRRPGDFSSRGKIDTKQFSSLHDADTYAQINKSEKFPALFLYSASQCFIFQARGRKQVLFGRSYDTFAYVPCGYRSTVFFSYPHALFHFYFSVSGRISGNAAGFMAVVNRDMLADKFNEWLIRAFRTRQLKTFRYRVSDITSLLCTQSIPIKHYWLFLSFECWGDPNKIVLH